MALNIGYHKGTISEAYFHELLTALENIPQKVQQVIELDDQIREIAAMIKNSHNALYLGRGYNFPVALEGALKLKEISYIHAEGYPAAEMKHGPIALVCEECPSVFLATSGEIFHKSLASVGLCSVFT